MTTAKRSLWNRSTIAIIVSIWTSACASVATVTALGLQVFAMTERELDLGLLGLAEFAPSALLVLVTGTIADRFDRRRICSIAAALEALTGVGLALYALSDPTSIAPIFAMVIAFGIGRAFLAPSNRALPADIVAPKDLPWLTARRAIAWQTATIAGPIIGGFLFDVDSSLPYVAMAVLLTISSASMFFVRTRLEDRPDLIADVQTELDPTIAALPTPGRLREAVEGLRFIRRSPVLLGTISLDLFAVLFGGAVALLPALADRLAIDSGGVGLLRAAGGAGAAITTLWIARKPISGHVGKWLLAVVAIFGVFTVTLGATTSFVIALISMAMIHGADAVSVFIRSTLVPLITPSDKRGRVLAVESVFIGASNELGAFESGVAGQVLGAPGAIILGGAATLVVAGTYWVAFPALRNVDRFPE